jgi:polyisoprenoid-binding protein YceI
MEAQGTSDPGKSVWVIDKTYTTVDFTVKNLYFFTVEGRFADVTGTIELYGSDIRRSSVEASINSASIETRNKRRDVHLRSADFLDAKRYPFILFKSTSVERGRDRDSLKISGALTIKDVSRPVVLQVTELERSRSPNGEEVAYYAAVLEINRHDFGINYRRFIGRQLKIVIQVQALRQK